MNQHIREIESKLLEKPVRISKQKPEDYVGGGQSKLRYLGHRVPQLHETLQDGFSFSRKDDREIARIWDHVWRNSDCYEVMSLALSWFYHPERKPDLSAHWKTLKRWSARIDNWAHSDTLSGIYARILEE